jgi:mono/diheme cytochrome c family protein
MSNHFVIGLAVAAATGGLLGSAVRAQAPSTTTTTTAAASVTAGVYTADQAKRGQMVYGDACAKCHLDDLSGGATSPPLKGADFLSGWKGKSVGALFDEVRMTMPFDSPGSLTPAQYADVLAYVFSENKFPPGDKELDKDPAPLQQIKIEAPAP